MELNPRLLSVSDRCPKIKTDTVDNSQVLLDTAGVDELLTYRTFAEAILLALLGYMYFIFLFLRLRVKLTTHANNWTGTPKLLHWCMIPVEELIQQLGFVNVDRFGPFAQQLPELGVSSDGTTEQKVINIHR